MSRQNYNHHPAKTIDRLERIITEIRDTTEFNKKNMKIR